MNGKIYTLIPEFEKCRMRCSDTSFAVVFRIVESLPTGKVVLDVED